MELGLAPTPSLGKFLLRDGVLTAEQLSAALRQQVVFGGRLGTNLLELGYADHDELALALAQFHGVPAALVRHIRGADARARSMISPRLCVEMCALPLAFATAGGRKLVVCMRDPTDTDAIAALASVAHMKIVAAACPERTLFRLLAHHCGAPLPARMTAPACEPTTPIPSGSSGRLYASAIRELEEAPQLVPTTAPMPDLSLVELDHEAALRDPSQLVGEEPLSLSELAERLRHKRTSEPPVAAAQDDHASVGPGRRRTPSSLAEALALAAAELPTKSDLSKPVPAGPPPLSLEAAVEATRAATIRSEVSDAVVAHLKAHFDAGLILVVRDAVAYGYRGFGGHFDDHSVESILLPLTTTSPFQVAHRDRRRYMGAGGGDERSMFGRFLRLFPLARRPELCVVEPLEVSNRIVCLVYAHVTGETPLNDNALDELTAVIEAMAAAFLRLIREQRRG